MNLRGKFQFLLAVFGISIVANVLVSVWCIGIYMEQATGRFHGLISHVQHVDRIRSLLDDLRSELQRWAEGVPSLDEQRYRLLCRRIEEQISELPTQAGDSPGREIQDRLTALGRCLSEESGRYVEWLQTGRRGEADEWLSSVIEGRCVGPIRQELGRLTRESSESITETSAQVHDLGILVAVILALNALAAFGLAAAGVHWVRNWVLKPVSVLKTAAEHHAAGDLQYRVPETSDDELGTLSREVNRMADSLVVIQRRLVEQERLAAVGEVASSIAHNIRNPLASIRASVQSSIHEWPGDGELRARQERIIETVDSLNRWLRELLMVNRPIELECQTVALGTLVRRVVDVTRVYAERRGVRFEVEESVGGGVVRADASRLEQALLAVVNNAVEASPPEKAVRIAVRDHADRPERVELRVSDSGPGIPPEVLQRIASPYFTTKPGGTGIGLHLAKRIVQAHGGTLGFQSSPEGGTTVVLALPAGACGSE